MPNDTATTATAKPTKQMVSKRELLDASGAVVDDWTDAKGFRYTTLASGHKAELMFEGDDRISDEMIHAFAAFGGLTLAGNVTNTVRNGKDKGASNIGDLEREALEAWIEGIKSGNWSEGRGDIIPGLGLLSEAYARVKTEGGIEMDVPTALETLKAKSKEDMKIVRGHDAIKKMIHTIQGERLAAKQATESVPIADL